jgi:hypothetical protein
MKLGEFSLAICPQWVVTSKPKLKAGTSLRAIAAELTRERVPIPLVGKWHLASVQRLVKRLAV